MCWLNSIREYRTVHIHYILQEDKKCQKNLPVDVQIAFGDIGMNWAQVFKWFYNFNFIVWEQGMVKLPNIKFHTIYLLSVKLLVDRWMDKQNRHAKLVGAFLQLFIVDPCVPASLSHCYTNRCKQHHVLNIQHFSWWLPYLCKRFDSIWKILSKVPSQ